LFSLYYNKAITDNALNPVSGPNITHLDETNKIIGQFDASGFLAEAILEVMPALDPVGYIGMELGVGKNSNPEELVQLKIEEAQERFAERKQVTDRPAKFGDAVVVDFNGTLDGQTTQGLAEQDYTINKLGAGNTVSGFDDHVAGMSVGESKTFDLTFPQNYNPSVAGKTAKFNLTLKNIVEVKFAEVNDYLAMMAGFTTVDEMKNAFNEEAQKTARRANDEQQELQIISKLVQENNVIVPESMARQEMNRIVQDLQQRQVQLNEQMVQNIQAAARYNIGRYLLVEAIYNKEVSLEITPDELDGFLTEHAARAGKSKDEFVSLLYNAKQMDSFLNLQKRDKVISFIVRNAKKQESE
jgi:trigger factor